MLLLTEETVYQNPLKNPIWIGLLIIVVPLLTMTLLNKPKSHRICLWLMVFWICHIKKPYYMELFFIPYRGVDRGFGIAISDFFFFAYLFSLLLSRDKIRVWWPKNFFWMWCLVIIAFLSLTNSANPYYGLFSIHKLVRGIILYWVMANVVRDRKDVETVVSALAFAILFQTYHVLFDKYVTHRVVHRSLGTFTHPNSLAMYFNIILPVLLCLLLIGKDGKHQIYLGFVLLCGMVSVVFTKSRGALFMMLAGLMMTASLSFFIKPTWQKLKLLIVGFCVVLVLGALVAPKIISRFKNAPKASEETRHYFNTAASAMANDYFWGTGINTFSWMLANTDYYWYVYSDVEWEDREDFREGPNSSSRLGTCHNIYLLWAAECGWVSMWVFILIIARFYLFNIVLIWKIRDEYYRSILIGLLGGLSTLHLQGMLEWIFRQTQVFYLFNCACGLLIAIYLNSARQKLSNHD